MFGPQTLVRGGHVTTVDSLGGISFTPPLGRPLAIKSAMFAADPPAYVGDECSVQDLYDSLCGNEDDVNGAVATSEIVVMRRFDEVDAAVNNGVMKLDGAVETTVVALDAGIAIYESTPEDSCLPSCTDPSFDIGTLPEQALVENADGSVSVHDASGNEYVRIPDPTDAVIDAIPDSPLPDAINRRLVWLDVDQNTVTLRHSDLARSLGLRVPLVLTSDCAPCRVIQIIAGSGGRAAQRGGRAAKETAGKGAVATKNAAKKSKAAAKAAAVRSVNKTTRILKKAFRPLIRAGAKVSPHLAGCARRALEGDIIATAVKGGAPSVRDLILAAAIGCLVDLLDHPLVSAVKAVVCRIVPALCQKRAIDPLAQLGGMTPRDARLLGRLAVRTP